MEAVAKAPFVTINNAPLCHSTEVSYLTLCCNKQLVHLNPGHLDLPCIPKLTAEHPAEGKGWWWCDLTGTWRRLMGFVSLAPCKMGWVCVWACSSLAHIMGDRGKNIWAPASASQETKEAFIRVIPQVQQLQPFHYWIFLSYLHY